ncbi:MAG: diacylglycerol kinase family lipid kinase [Coriobacteriia bacterium]|nr:diacylglycerol kinase family lipid kinase [Coriobacteriia bacterium]
MRIKVIANPGAGQPQPILSVLNDTLGAAGIDWDVAITHGPGDGYAAVRKAAEEGYDLIGAYGGDGTISEVAFALALGGPPMAIFPGGTGNALAEDLGIPKTLAEAATLVAGGAYDLRAVDMGRVGDSRFILRVTMGFEASIVEAATRELKDRYGWLAYVFAGLQMLSNPPRASYVIDVDGETIKAEGLACIIANSATTGVLGMRIADDVDVSDGLLDVIVVESADMLSTAGNALDAVSGQQLRGMTRWRGERIRVKSRPKQSVLADGEDAGSTPVEVSVTPGAIRVVVPKEASAAFE